MSLDWTRDVMDFHKKFAPGVPAMRPRVPDGMGNKDYCLGFIEEEFDEVKAAMDAGHLPLVADGLGDLIYVTIRAALIWGIDLRPVWNEIHAANMRKVGGHIREDNKVLKPPGWKAPDIEGILRVQDSIIL